ncbi:hypothetical protein, partial [Stenotrophomonas maltophilia]|uniref:hypothetical protein n=1 Tax=Stenotrophomonas maltophilia TaxID=40324 RepID=UPI0019544E2B
FDPGAEVLPMPASNPSRSIATADLMRRIETSKSIDMPPEPETDPRSEEERQDLLDGIYAELLSDPEAAFRPVPLLY